MGIFDILTPLLGPIIERVFPDPKDRYDFQVKMAALADAEASREHDEQMGQIQVDTVEAGSTNMFVAGWRPFIGWTGGVGVAYSFVIEPILDWSAKVVFHYAGTFPVLDTSQLMVLLTGMLGFGGLRTYEKIKGVPDSNPLVPQTVPNAVPPKKKVLGVAWPF